MKPYVLIVEDNADLMFTLNQVLIRKGYEVQSAGTGRDGLALFGGARLPDLVILDVGLPDMKGTEFLDEAEVILGQKLGNTSIVFYSAGEKLVDARVNGFIDKFLDLGDLLKCVDDFVASSPQRLLSLGQAANANAAG